MIEDLKEYSRVKVPVLTEKAIQGFTEEELQKREESISYYKDWSCFEADQFFYTRFIYTHLSNLNPREEKGSYLSIDLKSWITAIQLDLAESIDHREAFERFSKKYNHIDFTPEYGELLIHWINEGISTLKKKRIILDSYIGCDCNENPNHHVIFLS